MGEIFVDTSGWLCHFDASQPQHLAAKALIGACLARHQRLVTTNYVLVELIALFTSRRRISRSHMISCVEAIRSGPMIETIQIDASLHDQAWALLKARADKHWTLTDCAGFVVMQQRGIAEALTTDHHFEQAGFVRLLRNP